MRVSEQGRRNQWGHMGTISQQVLTEFTFLTFNISFDQENFLDFKDLGALLRQVFKYSGAPAELKLESSAPERRCRRHTILVVRSSCPARHQ